MKADNTTKSLNTFIVKALAFYFLWYVFRAFILSPFTNFDELFIEQLVVNNSALLVYISDFQVFLVDSQNSGFLDSIFAQEAGGLQVGEACDGIGIMSTFAIFILAFPGRLKWIFIPSGVLTLHLLNQLRIFSLVNLQVYYPSTLDFNHKYTFNILIYSLIFVLWYLYIKHFKKT